MTVWSPNWLRCCLCAIVIGAAFPGSGQAESGAPEPATEPTEIGASGDAYLKALRFRRIDTDVRYYDPTRPAPALETGVEPPGAEREDDDESGAIWGRVQVGLPAALVLIGVIALFLRYGGSLSVSFAREGQNAARGGHMGAAAATGVAPPASLQTILATADRRAALVRLAGTALARAVDTQGLLFQKSWTARDVLRHLPPATPYREELRALVFASERVHFGGRDVSEDEFRSHVARIRPLLEGVGA